MTPTRLRNRNQSKGLNETYSTYWDLSRCKLSNLQLDPFRTYWTLNLIRASSKICQLVALLAPLLLEIAKWTPRNEFWGNLCSIERDQFGGPIFSRCGDMNFRDVQWISSSPTSKGCHLKTIENWSGHASYEILQMGCSLRISNKKWVFFWEFLN